MNITTLAAFAFCSITFAAEKPLTPPDSKVKVPSIPESSDYEIKGIFGTGEDMEVSIAEKDGGKSEWFKVGKKKGDVLLESVDSIKGNAVIRVGKQKYIIKLGSEK